MLVLEQLTLNGAVTLLTYLQHDRLKDEAIGAVAIAATLCEMLSQLEATYPGTTGNYGWQQVHSDGVLESASVDYVFLDDDCYSGFKSASLS